MHLLKRKVSLDKFLPHVLAHTAGEGNDNMLPEGAAKSFILNSAISFAERSGFLCETIKVDLQCGMSKYPIESLQDETIIGVNKARLGDLSSTDCGMSWNWGGVLFSFKDDMLEIYPAPTKDIPAGLEVEIVVAPSRDSCELDAQFYDKWFDAVINGALAEIHMMPNYPWSSVSRSDARRRMFNEDVGRSTVRRVMDGTREPLKIEMNRDFACMGRRNQRRW